MGPRLSPEAARTEVAPGAGSPCQDSLQEVWGPLQLVWLRGLVLFVVQCACPCGISGEMGSLQRQ